MTTPFTTLLVANRGEIALRVMKSARTAGLKCIAVYTDADAGAPHVAFADCAVCIGAGPARDSYLSIDRILQAARDSGADAVHPGYGFLSESADFACACKAGGLVFVGPPPEAIELMGNKAAAKRHMIKGGVPCLPGYEGADQSDVALVGAAAKIGFPVMIKAAAGGGGRGMRLAANSDGFPAALHLAQSEALAAFGAGEVILEKAILRARHVEVQIFADRQGNVLHFGERDCSVQRRHQKVIEEAPCPGLSPDTRAKMAATAVAAVKSIGYEGAGTVEFLLGESGDFHFLEMNTRLQVEHAVTERVTGLDLVALQLSVAAGEALPLSQADIAITGHAMEARLYAEDPRNGFLPTMGKIHIWQPAKAARTDSGIVAGQQVSAFYDPLLAKVVAHGATRDAARKNLIGALSETVLFGPANNRDFLMDVLGRKTFADGRMTTGFVAQEYGDNLGRYFAPDFPDLALGAALLYRNLQAKAAQTAAIVSPELLGWGSPGVLHARMSLQLEDQVCEVTLVQARDQSLRVSDGISTATITNSGDVIRVDGKRVDLRAVHYASGRLYVATGTRSYVVAQRPAATEPLSAAGVGSIVAPMHGTLLGLDVATGDPVEPGQRLAVLEAMKMQHELLAQVSGTVGRIQGIAGTQVQAGDVLIEIDTKAEG